MNFLENKTDVHCIKVLKLYDMISKPFAIQLQEAVQICELVTDQVNGVINLHGQEMVSIWKLKGTFLVSGFLTISFQSGHGAIEVIINNKLQLLLQRGETYTITLRDIYSIDVRCSEKDGNCLADYRLTLQYKLKNKLNISKNCQFECFLSDQFGNPSNTLSYKEITVPAKRREVTLTDANGSVTILQRVKLLMNGFITIVLTSTESSCILCVLPFQFLINEVLCAPTNTFFVVEVFDTDCFVSFTEDGYLNLSMDFCLEIQVLAKTIINVDAQWGRPRSELIIQPSPLLLDYHFPALTNSF